MQTNVFLAGFCASKTVQLIIRKATRPPKIPKIDVEEPTMRVVLSQIILSSNPTSFSNYL